MEVFSAAAHTGSSRRTSTLGKRNGTKFQGTGVVDEHQGIGVIELVELHDSFEIGDGLVRNSLFVFDWLGNPAKLIEPVGRHLHDAAAAVGHQDEILTTLA